MEGADIKQLPNIDPLAKLEVYWPLGNVKTADDQQLPNLSSRSIYFLKDMDYLSFTDKKRTNTIQIEKCGDLVEPDSVDNLDKSWSGVGATWPFFTNCYLIQN